MREDEFVEFKETTGELNEAIVSIAAILNKRGYGTVWFGLKNDGTPHPFTIVDSTLRDVSRKISEAIRPQIFPIVETELVDEVQTIVVRFKGEDVPYSAFGKYYIPVADEDRELSPSELRNMMIKREYEEHWEERPTNEGVDDIDDEVFEKFYAKAVKCGRLSELGLDRPSLLKRLGLLNGDRMNNAGRVLFSKNRPLILKAAVFATDRKFTFLDLTREEGNIFRLLDVGVGYISKNMRWRVGLDADGLHRTETPEVPLNAAREAIVNSFAHARYDVPIEHEIDIFSDRISIVNPGSFASEFAPIDYATKDLESRLRNKKIAHILYLCKEVEVFGSGLRKLYSLSRDAGVKVDCICRESSFTLEFGRYFPDPALFADGGEIKLALRGGLNGTEMKYSSVSTSSSSGEVNGLKNVLNSGITESEFHIWNLLAKYSRLTSNELVARSSRSLRTVQRILRSLKDKRLIERIGTRRRGYWEIVR